MALKFVFNALQAKFDLVDIASTSAFAPSVPTSMQASLTIADHTQVLYRQHIIVGSRPIVIGTDASLIGV